MQENTTFDKNLETSKKQWNTPKIELISKNLIENGPSNQTESGAPGSNS